MKPNFFLVGAPKSGTSSLRSYLRDHPRIFMSDPKEPAYWATDYPGARRKHSIPLETLSDYLRLFERAEAHQHLAVGEASTTYLSSKEAVPALLKFQPEARLLVMIRNPVDFVIAWHRDRVWQFDETESLDRALDLQAERARGQSVPATCAVPQFLQYTQMASFGDQLERLMQLMPAPHLQVVLFDDFVASPAITYAEALRFLNLEHDGRTDFEVVNPAKTHRFRSVARLTMKPPSVLSVPVRACRRWARYSRQLRSLKRWMNRAPLEKKPVDPQIRARLISDLQGQIEKLSFLLQRDLSHWNAPA